MSKLISRARSREVRLDSADGSYISTNQLGDTPQTMLGVNLGILGALAIGGLVIAYVFRDKKR